MLRRVASAVHGAVEPKALRAEGGDPAAVIDFSSNQSPLGAAPAVAAAVATAVVDAYPDRCAGALCEAIARVVDVPSPSVVAGNGSTELIRLIAQLALAPGQHAVALGPSFGEYEVATLLCGAQFHEVRPTHFGSGSGFCHDEAMLARILAGELVRLCWICSPNNPTGGVIAPGRLVRLVHDHPRTLFVLDEAYCDLLDEPQWTQGSLAAGNLIVLRSLTKSWGLAGLRLGYCLAEESTAAALRAAAPPWSVNACAQSAGLAALADTDHHERSLALLRSERDRLMTALQRRGWATEPTWAGFFLVRVTDATELRMKLLRRGFLVRDCSSFGLPEYVRLSPRLPSQNDALLAAWDEAATP